MDNVKKLLTIGKEWKKNTGVKIKLTASYTSNQNRLAKKAIQNIK